MALSPLEYSGHGQYSSRKCLDSHPRKGHDAAAPAAPNANADADASASAAALAVVDSNGSNASPPSLLPLLLLLFKIAIFTSLGETRVVSRK